MVELIYLRKGRDGEGREGKGPGGKGLEGKGDPAEMDSSRVLNIGAEGPQMNSTQTTPLRNSASA